MPALFLEFQLQISQYQMWTENSQGWVLHWKYGSIIMPHQQYQIDQTAINLIAKPFTSTSQNTLQLDAIQANKHLKTLQEILFFLYNRQANKHSTINIQGGGVLLDIGGFACSIYMRGILNVNYIPTTLLSMVDATVGGKTGLNFGGKNMIGSISHPSKVIIDVKYLKTLTDRQFFNGFAEIIKIALVFDRQFFEYLQGLNLTQIRLDKYEQHLKYIIRKSLQLKAKVVEEDQFDSHQRKWLNFGHTLGHAIELTSNNSYLHGQCVSIGIVKALEIAADLGIWLQGSQGIRRVKKLLMSVHLPVSIVSDIDTEQLIALMLRDKKRNAAQKDVAEFVLISKVGQRCQKTTKIKVGHILKHIEKYIEIANIQNISQQINLSFPFPTSKSISLRLAYMAALSLIKFKQPTTIHHFLTSDDTHHMLNCLRALGFHFSINHQEESIHFYDFQPQTSATLNIGNSGVTARLILPLCASLPGNWLIECHPRMSQRPNQEIIKLCQKYFQCKMTYHLNQHSFPLKMQSKGGFGWPQSQIVVNGSLSSQFISSVMIYSGFFNNKVTINTQQAPTVSLSYLQMTAHCLSYYGINAQLLQGKIFIDSNNIVHKKELNVEIDLSSLSYPYAFAVLHNIPLPKLPENSIQGDVLFYKYVHQLITTTQPHISFDFDSCTDTFMTMAILIPCTIIQSSGLKTITIFNIANQRVKQSNRINLIIANLQKVGITIQEYPNSIKLYTNMAPIRASLIQFETQNDHRLAMSLAVLSSFLKIKHPSIRFIIDDKAAVEKTFPTFWKYLHQSGVKLQTNLIKRNPYECSNDTSGVLIIGDRGSGKSRMGGLLATKLGYLLIDLDAQITKELHEIGYDSIDSYVKACGWNAFRLLQSKLLQQSIGGNQSKKAVIVLGAGIVQMAINLDIIKRCSHAKIFIEREFEDLRIEITPHRPQIGNYRQISAKRLSKYQELATVIVNIPSRESLQEEFSFLWKNVKYLFESNKQLEGGMILMAQSIPKLCSQLTPFHTELAAIQFRIDLMAQQLGSKQLRGLRRQLAQFNKYNDISTLLTLRTKEEFGLFQGNYLQSISQIIKMPSNFIDYEYKHPFKFSHHQRPNVILSYHGCNPQIIQKLIKEDTKFMKKLCFKDSQNRFQEYFKALGPRNICVDLNNPITRLRNKHQFVSAQPLKINPNRMLSIAEMKLLKGLKHILLK